MIIASLNVIPLPSVSEQIMWLSKGNTLSSPQVSMHIRLPNATVWSTCAGTKGVLILHILDISFSWFNSYCSHGSRSKAHLKVSMSCICQYIYQGLYNIKYHSFSVFRAVDPMLSSPSSIVYYQSVRPIFCWTKSYCSSSTNGSPVLVVFMQMLTKENFSVVKKFSYTRSIINDIHNLNNNEQLEENNNRQNWSARNKNEPRELTKKNKL